jgi:hypothetical protein
MGLHNLAKHVQQKGRGNDSELVHMTPSEVRGLQALAKAHGGSLTVNPDTGLVEAGFLEQVLPIAAAAAATYFTAGAAAPALSAALGTTMGGIAAGGLAGAGVGGISAALQGGDVQRGMTMGGLGGAISGGMGAYDNVGNIFSSTAPGATTVTTAAPIAAPIATPAPALNLGDVEAQAGGFYGGQAPVNPYTNMTNAQITDVTGFKPNIINPNSPYAGYGTVGRAAVLAAPGIGASFGVVPQGDGIPDTNQNFGFATLSPNFQGYVPPQPNPYYTANYSGYAGGGIVALAPGGPVEQMSNQNTIMGGNNMFPQSQQYSTQFATPTQMPTSAEIVRSDYDSQTNPYTGQTSFEAGGSVKKKKQADLTPESNLAKMDPYSAAMARLNNLRSQAYLPNVGASQSAMNTLGGIPTAASGGLASLGSYSDGGRLLKGPGDGMSDNIPAKIGKHQPARLADGEFVVPADVVSHLGNGSTDAGAKRLYSMMDKIRTARTGQKKQGKQINPNKYLPA